MWPFSRNLDELREDDLQGLIGVRENVSLDFKGHMYSPKDPEEELKMLRDVTSMANAEGGVLIIGMLEDKKTQQATELRPVVNAEAEAARIIKTCLDNITERIPGLRTKRVSLDAGGEVFVVYIPRSYRRPHMLITNEVREFWIRHDRGNAPMSVAEIRTAVTSTEDAAMKVERFVRARHRGVRTLLELGSEPLLTLTATPLLLEEGRVDVGAQGIRELVKSPPRYGSRDPGQLTGSYPNVIPTLHGIRNGMMSIKRLELFRTGHIEFGSREELTHQFRTTNQKYISSPIVAKAVRNFAHFATKCREVSQISDPYLFSLTFWRISKLAMTRGLSGDLDDGDSKMYQEEEHLTVPLMFSYDDAADAVARQILDRFWNAFGYDKCPFFDPNGAFVLRGHQ